MLYMFVFPVHPCDKPTKGGCSQDCVKKGETFVCTCKIPDFKLNDDGKTCDEGTAHPSLEVI